MRFHLTIKDREGLPPCQSITVGKLDFRRYTTINSTREGLPDQTYHGAAGEYDEADVAEFHEKVKHLVVRWGWSTRKLDGREVTRLWSAAIFDTRCKEFFPTDRDEPLSRYLDVQPITVGVPTSFVGATAEQIEASSSARASEERARQDPRDARERAKHARAKRDGETVEG